MKIQQGDQVLVNVAPFIASGAPATEFRAL